MNNTAEQFMAANKTNLQALEGLTTQAFAGVEKLAELNMAAAKAALTESFGHIQSVLSVKDAQELIALQSGMMKPLADKSAAYAKHVQTIVTDSSTEFTKAVEAKAAEAQKSFSGVVETMTKNAPAGTESMVTAFKTALANGQTAVETAQVSAKKAMEAAQSNFSAAATQAVDAVKKATKTA